MTHKDERWLENRIAALFDFNGAFQASFTDIRQLVKDYVAPAPEPARKLEDDFPDSREARIAYLDRDDNEPAEAEPSAPVRECPGTGGKWCAGTGAPICPVCHRGPKSMGADSKRPIPPHAQPNDCKAAPRTPEPAEPAPTRDNFPHEWREKLAAIAADKTSPHVGVPRLQLLRLIRDSEEHDVLLKRISAAVEASRHGSASDAVQAMLDILDPPEGFDR